MAAPLDFARRAGYNAARLARRVMDRATLPPGRGFWVALRLEPPIEEQRPPSLLFGRETPHGLLDVLQVLEAAARDPQVDGVVVRLGGAPRGWGKLAAVRRALLGVREAGKPVAAWAEQLDTPDLWLGTAATRLWLPPSGSVFLVGLRAEGLFLRGLLDHLGVRADVVRIGGFKTAGDMFERQHMSAEERRQTEELLDDLYAELVDGISRGRHLDPDAVRACVDAGPYTAEAAVGAGLVDACLYPDELEDALEALTPEPPAERSGPRRIRLVDSQAYASLRVRDAGWRPLLGDLPRIAYVVVDGVIRRGRGLSGVTSDAFRSLLEQLRRDEGVRGVVLRVSSPGGDALASDLLFRALRRMGRDKPVVVSMGDVAASGGYFLAAAGDAVFAEAPSVTGSIGVVGGKLDLEGLYARIGVGRDAVERGARAGLLSASRGFTPEERAVVRDGMEAVYAGFLDRVAEGRAMARDEVERVAGGRVWSGGRARGVGLVDRLGGPLEALAEARLRAGLRHDEPALLETHPRIPRLPGLAALVGMRRRASLF